MLATERGPGYFVLQHIQPQAVCQLLGANTYTKLREVDSVGMHEWQAGRRIQFRFRLGLFGSGEAVVQQKKIFDAFLARDSSSKTEAIVDVWESSLARSTIVARSVSSYGILVSQSSECSLIHAERVQNVVLHVQTQHCARDRFNDFGYNAIVPQRVNERLLPRSNGLEEGGDGTISLLASESPHTVGRTCKLHLEAQYNVIVNLSASSAGRSCQYAWRRRVGISGLVLPNPIYPLRRTVQPLDLRALVR